MTIAHGDTDVAKRAGVARFNPKVKWKGAIICYNERGGEEWKSRRWIAIQLVVWEKNFKNCSGTLYSTFIELAFNFGHKSVNYG